MSKILISYDLNNPGRDYTRISDRIKQLGAAGWCKPLESTWLIITNWDPLRICKDLEGYCDASSRLLVVDVSAQAMAWNGLQTDASDWLKAN